MAWSSKDPLDVLGYELKWIDYLDAGETITASSWAVEDGDVVIDSTSFSDDATVVRVSGGTAGLNNVLRNIITTTGDGVNADTKVDRINLVVKAAT